MHGLQRGDTIIEVLFAVSVFSLIAVGAIMVMNQGIATAQKALEITQVRQQMDAQAEALRYAHHSYVMSLGTGGGSEEWNKLRIKAGQAGSISPLEVTGNPQKCNDIPGRAFIMNARRATVELDSNKQPKSISSSEAGYTPPPFAKVSYLDSQAIERVDGIWIEAQEHGGSGGVGYIDFHIRACWESPGAGPVITLGTIVRLYELAA